MRGIVTKMFIQSREEQTFGKPVYRLGAVCRGDDNKDWAAATPSGSVQISNTPLLDELFARQERELLLIWRPDVAGEWELTVTVKPDRFTEEQATVSFPVR